MRLSLEALRDMGDSSLAGLMPILGRLVEAEAEQRRQVKGTSKNSVKNMIL